MQGAHTAQYGHDQVMPCPAHHTLLLKSPATILPVCRASHLLSILCISVMSAPLLPLVFGHPSAGACRAPHPPSPLPLSLLLLVLLFCNLCDPQERGTKKRQHSRFRRVTCVYMGTRVCACVCVRVCCVRLCACVCVFGCVVVLFALGVWVGPQPCFPSLVQLAHVFQLHRLCVCILVIKCGCVRVFVCVCMLIYVCLC